jgi:hypothetical protein
MVLVALGSKIGLPVGVHFLKNQKFVSMEVTLRTVVG